MLYAKIKPLKLDPEEGFLMILPHVDMVAILMEDCITKQTFRRLRMEFEKNWPRSFREVIFKDVDGGETEIGQQVITTAHPQPLA